MVMNLAFSPDGRLLAASYGHAGLISIIDIATLAVLTELGGSIYHEALAWNPDGTLFAAAVETGIYPLTSFKLQIWDGNVQTVLHEISLPFSAEPAIGWSPDGSSLIHANAINCVIRDTSTWEPVLSLQGHEHPVESLSWSPDGSVIATTDYLTVRIWDAATGEQLASFPKTGSPGWIPRIAWSPDGRQVVSTRGNVIEGWNVENGQAIFRFQAVGTVGGLVWSPSLGLIYSSEDAIHTLNSPLRSANPTPTP